MQPTYADRRAGRRKDDPVVDRRGARDHRTRDNDSAAADCEGPVDGEPERSSVSALVRRQCRAFEVVSQFVDARPGLARHLDDIRTVEKRTGHECPHLLVHLGNAFDSNPVDLVQRHAPGAQAEQAQDLQVLAGLGHDAVVGGR